MKHNAHREFAGLEQLKQKQKWQLAQFQLWASENRWAEFHDAHYDWWMFPVDQRSAYGFAWTVFDDEISQLRQDSQYIRSYLEGVRLLALSWGWDLEAQAYIAHPHQDQKWHQWPVRLYKCAKSLQLFGFDSEFASMNKLAIDLMAAGEKMTFGGHDLSRIFK